MKQVQVRLRYSHWRNQFFLRRSPDTATGHGEKLKQLFFKKGIMKKTAWNYRTVECVNSMFRTVCQLDEVYIHTIQVFFYTIAILIAWRIN